MGLQQTFPTLALLHLHRPGPVLTHRPGSLPAEEESGGLAPRSSLPYSTSRTLGTLDSPHVRSRTSLVTLALYS